MALGALLSQVKKKFGKKDVPQENGLQDLINSLVMPGMASLGISAPGSQIGPAALDTQKPPAIPGAAAATTGQPTGPAAFTPTHLPETAQIQAMIQEALGALKAPPPVEKKAEVTPIEALAGFFAAQGNPQNAGGAYRLAQERVAPENARAQQEWAANQTAARTQLQYGVPMMNALLDKEAALDRVQQTLIATDIKQNGKLVATAAKANEQIRFKVADQIAKGTASPASLTSLFMANGSDPRDAEAAAGEVWAQIQNGDQSWMIGYKEHQLQMQEDAAMQAQIDDAWKILNDDVNQSDAARMGAGNFLFDKDPNYALKMAQSASLRDFINNTSPKRKAHDTALAIANKTLENWQTDFDSKMKERESILNKREFDKFIAQGNLNIAQGKLFLQGVQMDVDAQNKIADAAMEYANATSGIITNTQSNIRMLQSQLGDMDQNSPEAKSVRDRIAAMDLQLKGGLDPDGNEVRGLLNERNDYWNAAKMILHGVPKIVEKGVAGAQSAPVVAKAQSVAQAAKSAGFSGDALVTAVAIAMAESGGDPTQYNGKGKDNSYGLWQINMIGKMGPDRVKKFGLKSADDLYDPKKNAAAAYYISGGGKDWSPWTTYTSGAYKQYMDAARQALGMGGGQGAPKNQTPPKQGPPAKPAAMSGGGNVRAIEAQDAERRIAEYRAYARAHPEDKETIRKLREFINVTYGRNVG